MKIDAQKFNPPSATLVAAHAVGATIRDQDRKDMFFASLLSGVDTFYRVAIAQQFFEQMPSQSTPHFPDDETMVRRMNLIIEEFKETFEKGLGIQVELSFHSSDRVETPAMGFSTTELSDAIQLSDRSKWDLDEFADGLSDMNVVIAGTGVECALPMDLLDWDNHCANMSKLGDDARPQINNITPGFRGLSTPTEYEGDGLPEPGYRPDLPTGKWIKGPNYVQTDPSYIMGLKEE